MQQITPLEKLSIKFVPFPFKIGINKIRKVLQFWIDTTRYLRPYYNELDSAITFHCRSISLIIVDSLMINPKKYDLKEKRKSKCFDKASMQSLRA